MALKRVAGMGLEKFQEKGTPNKIKALEEENLMLKLALAETVSEHEVQITELKLAIAELGAEG